MAQTVLPFEYDANAVTPWDELYPQLPPGLQEACNQSLFLVQYLQTLPTAEIGVPQFYLKPARSLSDLPYRNLIYAIKDGLYVHIYPDTTGARDHHIAIEPTTVMNIDHLIPEIEDRLVAWAEEIGRLEEVDAKRALLLKLLDSMCTTTRVPRNNNSRKPERIFVSPQELEALRYRVLRDKIGMGVLQPLLLDPYIEDISCSGVGHIFIEHKIFKSVQSS
ncbi:MAG TPA: hypothetical protein VHO69_06565, partial [Phototrophicaceae bacterium]|nr:hypothetical protein [Phototrophicaceae bacterium]